MGNNFLLLILMRNNSSDCATIIWAKNETEDASSENRQDQAKVNTDVFLF